MSEPFYVVKLDMPQGSYLRPSVFENKTAAIKFANLLRNRGYPSDEYKVHFYEVKEIEF